MGYREQVIADGATAYWRLEESSGTSAATEVGANTGTISGGVTLNQAGVAGGKAMAFNGSTGKIAVGALALGPAAYSVEAWIKVVGTAQIPFFSNRESGAGTTAVFGVDSVSGRVFVYIGSFIYGTTSLWDGRWHHAVVTHDGSTMRIYVDGVLESQTASAIPNGSGIASIGCDVNVVFWNGSIDEVAVYPTALTAAQIANHYQLGLPKTYRDAVLMDGAIAYWRLNDSASPAASQVGTFPGTIAGGVTLNQPGAILGGKSMLFDGATGRIDMGDIAAFEFPSGTLTLAGWLRFTDMSAQRIFAGKSDFGVTYKGWTLFQNQASAGNMRLFVRDAASATISDTVTNVAVNNGAWRFIAVTVGANWAPANVNWYIDGAPAGKTVLNGSGGTADANTQPFRLGAPSNGVSASNNWNGSIADFAIYDKVLTAAQIANQFNLAAGGQGGAPTEFRSRYRLRDAA